ncbi:MAG: hypothetical protein QXE81_03105 [Desulfurococcaceae archaeon]
MIPTELLILFVFLFVLLYMIYDTYRRRPRRTLYIVRESLKCTKCGLIVEREFEPGDFIGIIKGKCPTCGGDLKVKSIYAVEKK